MTLVLHSHNRYTRRVLLLWWSQCKPKVAGVGRQLPDRSLNTTSALLREADRTRVHDVGYSEYTMRDSKLDIDGGFVVCIGLIYVEIVQLLGAGA